MLYQISILLLCISTLLTITCYIILIYRVVLLKYYNILSIRRELEALKIRNQGQADKLVVLSKQIKKSKRFIYRLQSINAHDIRGPLARILGLASLTKYDAEQDLIDQLHYFDLVEKDALEIDRVLKEVNEEISDDTFFLTEQ